MNLIDLLQFDGYLMKKVSSTHGGEYAGPCPYCRKGRDRFRVFPDYHGGRFWCRQCCKSGDAIQYLRDCQGLSYIEACEKMGTVAGRRSSRRKRRSVKSKFIPREVVTPDSFARWAEEAEIFLRQAGKRLWAEGGGKARSFLHDRGLTSETILKAELGLIPEDCYHDRSSWGLPEENNENGRKKKVWTPAGILIPWRENGRAIRLRIRRDPAGDGPRYVIIPGSSMTPMKWNMDREVLTIVESELDGLLVDQEAGDMTGVIALGSVSMRPDRETHELLMKARMILVALDHDRAGALESRRFWKPVYGNKAKRWMTPVGKDPSEARQKGLSIRAWITAAFLP